AIRWPVGIVLHSRPEGPEIVSPVMPKRSGERPMGNRMRRSKRAMNRGSGPRECLVRGQHQRGCAKRRDKRPIHSIRHGTYPFVGCRAALQRTLSRAFRARKRMINYWLRLNINREAFFRRHLVGKARWRVPTFFCWTILVGTQALYPPH